MTKTNKIIIATGGTGGHVFPAYSLANYLIKNNYNWNLNLSEIARIWTAGCIIKSDLMVELVEVLKSTDSILKNDKIIQQIKAIKPSANPQYPLIVVRSNCYKPPPKTRPPKLGWSPSQKTKSNRSSKRI